MNGVKINEKDILMKITVTRPVTNKEVVLNFVGNLMTRAGGDIPSKVHLILTKEALYMEYVGHAAIGYAEEIRKVEVISLSDLKDFLVTADENKEVIEIKTSKKDFTFYSEEGNRLALTMSKLIKEM